MSLFSGCRRLHRRYEREPEHFLAFTVIDTSLINYRRLALGDAAEEGFRLVGRVGAAQEGRGESVLAGLLIQLRQGVLPSGAPVLGLVVEQSLFTRTVLRPATATGWVPATGSVAVPDRVEAALTASSRRSASAVM